MHFPFEVARFGKLAAQHHRLLKRRRAGLGSQGDLGSAIDAENSELAWCP